MEKLDSYNERVQAQARLSFKGLFDSVAVTTSDTSLLDLNLMRQRCIEELRFRFQDYVMIVGTAEQRINDWKSYLVAFKMEHRVSNATTVEEDIVRVDGCALNLYRNPSAVEGAIAITLQNVNTWEVVKQNAAAKRDELFPILQQFREQP
jgi:hypothetical protein